MTGELVEIRVGDVAALGPDKVPSGFRKYPVSGPVAVGLTGLDGDAQADLTVHGGRDKAVYAYPLEGYAAWRTDMPHLHDTLVPGGMGENLSTLGFDEDSVCIGDVWHVGTALLQVCQPRQPCFKLALFHNEPHMIRVMTRSGRSGWYFRVLEPGVVAAGDRIAVVERVPAAWSIRRFAAVVSAKHVPPDLLAEIIAMPGLADRWQAKARAMRK